MAKTIVMDNLYIHYRSARLLSHILDEQFKIGKFRFGLDPILDIFPIGGDLVGAALSFYIVWIAVEMRVPAEKVAQMIGNIIFDFFMGIIPGLSLLTDAVFKANTRNIKILEEHLPEDFTHSQKTA